ncbi:xanthine dehydrogenase [Sneathiella chungangensis]|uniref:Xanthine dehydrogenase n=1 Tax=Sneathiella chungangensis TaxID=1418234 RepID=A0A845MCL5_9PROT|nr:XdhC family protein [Sneathiella chungangensis]MZR21090.1 xanthine dehydrogenase [Sneathiella chungangensis]
MKTALLEDLQKARAEKRQVVLATNLTSGEQKLLYPFESKEIYDVIEAARGALRNDKPTTVETEDGPVFLNIFNPPLRLFIVGAVHIAQALVPMAAGADYEVTVIDPRRSFGSSFRFPNVTLDDRWPDDAFADLHPDRRSAIVTLTHDAKLDDPALQYALRSDAFYIGALGSGRTHAKRQQRLQKAGFSDEDFARIHGPIGLDIGAKSPAEIAISIMAEITAVLRGKAGS